MSSLVHVVDFLNGPLFSRQTTQKVQEKNSMIFDWTRSRAEPTVCFFLVFLSRVPNILFISFMNIFQSSTSRSLSTIEHCLSYLLNSAKSTSSFIFSPLTESVSRTTRGLWPIWELPHHLESLARPLSFPYLFFFLQFMHVLDPHALSSSSCIDEKQVDRRG